MPGGVRPSTPTISDAHGRVDRRDPIRRIVTAVCPRMAGVDAAEA
jgi:hypothetical protein